MSSRRHTGIDARHRSGCPAHEGGRCKCRPAYRAEVWSAAEGKRLRKTFPTLAAARAWRDDAKGEVRRGHLRADPGRTLREAAEEWLAGARAGTIFTRSGDPFKPRTLRGYEEALRLRVLPELGALPLREVSRAQLQRFARGLTGNPATIRNTLLPVRAIYRWALAEGEVATNPTLGIELPAVRGKRERAVNPSEASALIEHAPEADRALWATALYAGLRLGELQALRWRNLDFERGLIRVERSWDAREGEIEPKSRAGRRSVPMPGALREHLPEPGDPDALVFGRSGGRPFDGGSITKRARRAWEAAKLNPITLHEARHSYASMLIEGGHANAKALSTYLGHASIGITFDRYGHLMEGNEAEAAEAFDRYLRKWGKNGAARRRLQRVPAVSAGF